MTDYKDVTTKDGHAILSRALSALKRRLGDDKAVRQGMPPGPIREAFDFRALANEQLPVSPALRAGVTRALREKTQWALDTDVLIPAVARWLSENLEPCLEEIWTSRRFIQIRVTRTSIHVEKARGPASPSAGRLPGC